MQHQGVGCIIILYNCGYEMHWLLKFLCRQEHILFDISKGALMQGIHVSLNLKCVADYSVGVI